MGKLVFSLRNVPDDEAEAVRTLLAQNRIDFYETSAGNWGISTPALWLSDPADLDRARGLIDAYEKQRSEDERARYASLKAAGKQRRLIDALKESPLRTVLYIGFSLFILYVSLAPFFELGK